MMKNRNALLILSGALSLPLMMVITAASGDMPIAPADVVRAIANGLGIGHYRLSPIDEGIVWQYRMSRALMAACSGGGLALCGLILQTLLRNPLAEPWLLGISAGASTGAVCIMLLGVGGGLLGVGSGAFIGACCAFGLIMLLAGGLRDGATRIILAGVAGTQLFNALTAWVVSTSANAEQSRGVMFWLMGSLSGVRWPEALLGLAAAAAGLVIALCYARSLDAFAFGEEVAATLGIPVIRLRVVLLLVTALVTATIVSAIGAVGFVGLVIPHVARMLTRTSHLTLIPIVFLMGSHFMILADLASRSLIAHQVLPVGVVTALIGAPAFAIILYRTREKPQ
jgi:iron complex transport system permease protein